MKKLNYVTIILFLPLIFSLLFFPLSSLLGCNGDEAHGMNCPITGINPIMNILFMIALLTAFGGVIIILPGVVISIVSFVQDYQEIKKQKLPLKTIFKRFSFYPLLISFLIIISFVIITIFNIIMIARIQ